MVNRAYGALVYVLVTTALYLGLVPLRRDSFWNCVRGVLSGFRFDLMCHGFDGVGFAYAACSVRMRWRGEPRPTRTTHQAFL